MSKLVNKITKPFKSLWHSFEDGSAQIGEALGYQSAGVTPKSDKTRAAERAAIPPVIPVPDEEALRRDRRRRLAGSVGRTGRAATVLSQEDDLLG